MGSTAFLLRREQEGDLKFCGSVRDSYKLLEVDDRLLQEIVDSGYATVTNFTLEAYEDTRTKRDGAHLVMHKSDFMYDQW